jgi:hypothetical protein
VTPPRPSIVLSKDAEHDLASEIFSRNMARPGATEAGVLSYIQSIFDVGKPPRCSCGHRHERRLLC